MMKEYQVTLMCKSGKYRPVSCIIKEDEKKIAEVGLLAATKQKGIIKICQKRGWTGRELKEYGYTKIKVREYDKEKIEKENAERYAKIKAEKGWN